MKKTKINLLSSRNDYLKYERIFSYIRISSIVLGLIFFVILIIYLGLIAINLRKIDQLTVIKKQLLVQLQSKDLEQANIILINQKFKALKDFLKEDAKSLPYYNLLSTALLSSSESGTLKSFSIAKNRETNFNVGFQNFSELMSFFRFVESQKFLKNFEKVSLKNFTAIQNTKDQKEKYELTFSGIFIAIPTD